MTGAVILQNYLQNYYNIMAEVYQEMNTCRSINHPTGLLGKIHVTNKVQIIFLPKDFNIKSA